MADDSTYVCPQCGPDPRGSEVHTEDMHVWHGADPERDDSLAMALGDLDTYEAEVAKLNRQVEELAGENAWLRQRAEKAEAERDEALDALTDAMRHNDDTCTAVAERDRLQARLDTATAHVDELRGQRDEARAEVAYLRGRIDRVLDRHAEYHTLCNADEYELRVAASAWRAAQPDQTTPTDRPTARVSQDQGADDGAGTEGSQAQGGARGDGWRREGKVVHFDIPTPVQTLAGIVLRLTKRVQRLERRLNAHDAEHKRAEEEAYHEAMEQAEYE